MLCFISCVVAIHVAKYELNDTIVNSLKTDHDFPCPIKTKSVLRDNIIKKACFCRFLVFFCA